MTVIEVPGFGFRAGVIVYLATGGILGLLLGRRAAFLAMQLASETLVGGLCARVHRRPFIALSTASGELSEVREALSSPFRVVHRANLRRASFLVGQTSAAAAELRAFAAPERIAVIHNPLPEMGGHGHDGEPKAVFTGRLEKYKDLGVLLEAWEAVVKRIPAARLVLVGSGGEYRSVEPVLKRTVAERPDLRRSVTFTGWVSDVEEYLRGADVYVLPSRSEGMSNALLEACAARRIIVASDIVPNREVLGADYPLLFTTGDPTSLASALVRAFDDDETRTEAIAAIDRRLGQLEAEPAAARIEKLIVAADSSRY